MRNNKNIVGTAASACVLGALNTHILLQSTWHGARPSTQRIVAAAAAIGTLSAVVSFTHLPACVARIVYRSRVCVFCSLKHSVKVFVAALAAISEHYISDVHTAVCSLLALHVTLLQLQHRMSS